MMNVLTRRPQRLMLATLLVAATAAAVATADAAPRGAPDGMGPPAPMMMMFGGPHLDRLLDGVNATPDQRTQLKSIFDAARVDLRTLHDADRALREQLTAAFTEPTVDARTVEALRQQMLAQHDKASQRQMQALLDASRVLGADQRKALVDRMAEHRAAMDRQRADRMPAAR